MRVDGSLLARVYMTERFVANEKYKSCMRVERQEITCMRVSSTFNLGRTRRRVAWELDKP